MALEVVGVLCISIGVVGWMRYHADGNRAALNTFKTRQKGRAKNDMLFVSSISGHRLFFNLQPPFSYFYSFCIYSGLSAYILTGYNSLGIPLCCSVATIFSPASLNSLLKLTSDLVTLESSSS